VQDHQPFDKKWISSRFEILAGIFVALQQNSRRIPVERVFFTHRLSPPPSEKVDLPQAARLGAFFWPLSSRPTFFSGGDWLRLRWP
jgi:hypothetical protein